MRNLKNIEPDELHESHKWRVPYLLSRDDLKFLGAFRDGEMVSFRFSPKETAIQAVNDFELGLAVVNVRTFIEKVEYFRNVIHRPELIQ